jgi:hypothetical protein
MSQVLIGQDVARGALTAVPILNQSDARRVACDPSGPGLASGPLMVPGTVNGPGRPPRAPGWL